MGKDTLTFSENLERARESVRYLSQANAHGTNTDRAQNEAAAGLKALTECVETIATAISGLALGK